MIRFSEDNPDCSVLPLDNGGAVVCVGDNPLYLNGRDFGMGAAALRLYRDMSKLLGTGCPILTATVSDGAHYEQVEDQLEDLKKLQEYTKLSRKLTALRFSELYYGTKALEEIAFDIRDCNCHGIDTVQRKIYLLSKKYVKNKNLLGMESSSEISFVGLENMHKIHHFF